MNEISVFLTGVGLTVITCISVVGYLKSHLQKILVDLCGTELRANFWMAFSNVTLVLVPMVFAMQFHPKMGDTLPVIFQLNYQLKWVLVGLISSVGVLGTILSLFILFLAVPPRVVKP